MRTSLLSLLIVTGFMIFDRSASAAEMLMDEPATIDLTQMKLRDIQGNALAFADKGVAVFIETGTKCPIVRKYLPTIGEIKSTFSPKGVRFVMVDSAANETKQDATEEAKKLKTDVPVIFDADQSIAKSLGLRFSSQAVVVWLNKKQIVYRGGIDDGINFYGQRTPREHYLKDAIESALNGEMPKRQTARTYGCALTFR